MTDRERALAFQVEEATALIEHIEAALRRLATRGRSTELAALVREVTSTKAVLNGSLGAPAAAAPHD